MKIKTNIISFALLLSAFIPSLMFAGQNKQFLIEKYTKQLESLSNAHDSVKVLYNLFDLSDRTNQETIAWQIYNTAGRAKNINAQMDMLRNLATFNNDDSVLNMLQSLADKIPNDDARAATKTFIFNRQVSMKSRNPNDDKFSTILLDSIVNSHNLQGNNVYDRLALVYQILQYIGVEAEGSLFIEYTEKYADIIDHLPDSDFPLKNQFYTTSAIVHSRINGDQRKSVACDRKLLEIIDQLQKMYLKQNRKFRNYDINKFISYQRILSNFKVLSAQEIETVHDSIMSIYYRDSDVKNSYDTTQLVKAYYHFARGEYNKALPCIKVALEKAHLSIYNRIKLLDMLIKSAKAVGDHNTYVHAMEDYINSGNIIDSMRSIANNREVVIRNTILNTPLLQDTSSTTQPKESKSRELDLMVVSSLLAVLLIIYMILYVRLRRKRNS